jgi:hypothetical protein
MEFIFKTTLFHYSPPPIIDVKVIQNKCFNDSCTPFFYSKKYNLRRENSYF